MGKASRKKALRRVGVGGYKLSEALIELVSPFMRDDMALQERENLFMVATIAWNISIYPSKQRGRQILQVVGDLPDMPANLEERIALALEGKTPVDEAPEEKLHLMEFIIALIARRDELYPHDRRLIQDIELAETDGRFNLKVLSTLAPPDFGSEEA